MSDFRRFYGPGLEHALHLEELQRSASTSRIRPVGPRRKTTPLRRWLALLLTTWAARIDPIGMPHGGKATETVS